MPLLTKTLAALASGALLATAPVAVSAANARPAPHQKASAHRHAKAHGKPVDKLAGARHGAAQAIGAQLKTVQRLVVRAGTLTIGDAARLGDALNADLAALRDDFAAVPGATTKAELRRLKAAAVVARQVATLQFTVVTTTDAAAEETASLTVLALSVQGQLADLVDVDVEAGLAALADVLAQLESVAGELPGVVDSVLLIAPTVSRADLHAAMDDFDQTLTTIADTLAQAALDIATVQETYGL